MTETSRADSALARRFPGLARALPRVSIGKFPTPLEPAPKLQAAVGGIGALYIKDDGGSSPHYGGNKVRKLEYLLGDAIRRGAREVMTFGFTGSNHAAATAVHASRLGLRSISMLLPQAEAPYVADNLAVSRAHGAEIHCYRNALTLVAGCLGQLVSHRLKSSRWPHVIAPGGSSALGTVGFVAAAMELAEQCASRGFEVPQRIYVALGSCGTAVGLALGAAIAGLSTRIVAVRVTEPRHANRHKTQSLWDRSCALLHRTDPAFPVLPYDCERIEIRDEHFGAAYAVPTAAAREAIDSMRAYEGIALDVAYTGKTLACLIADARAGRLHDCDVVFWNTYDSQHRASQTKNPCGPR